MYIMFKLLLRYNILSLSILNRIIYKYKYIIYKLKYVIHKITFLYLIKYLNVRTNLLLCTLIYYMYGKIIHYAYLS